MYGQGDLIQNFLNITFENLLKEHFIYILSWKEREFMIFLLKHPVDCTPPSHSFAKDLNVDIVVGHPLIYIRPKALTSFTRPFVCPSPGLWKCNFAELQK